MPDQTQNLGGRLPLLDPRDMSGDRKKIYDLINKTMVPWAEKANFQSKTEDGRFIGPFNPSLYSPQISIPFLEWQEAEGKYTTLNERVRQVIILTVGSVWKAPYELYAHSAVARKAGISEDNIQKLVAGELLDDLGAEEKLAQRFAEQLSTEHRVDAELYREAEQALGQQGLVDLVNLVGAYFTVCALLNAFEVPAPV